MYVPPFQITSKIVNLIAEISEAVGALGAAEASAFHVRLRKENRIKTIHASLAIEQNSLSLEQVTAILEGKAVLGPPREILEVKNAIQAYQLLLELNPFDEQDLLRAHRLMMRDLVGQSGRYRTGGVGIFDGSEVIHVAPPASRVPLLMADLFSWLKTSDLHPLLKSCVFHYEFEFIHPFEDGNGRMGRLWQNVILKDWKRLFAWIPVETLMRENQQAYYRALGTSDAQADSTPFIELMLSLLLTTLRRMPASDTVNDTVNDTVKLTENQRRLLEILKRDPTATMDALAKQVGIARRNVALNLKKLQEARLLERIGADRNGRWVVKE